MAIATSTLVAGAAIAASGAAAYSSISQANAAKKAAAAAGQQSQVDTTQLNTQTSDLARKNAQDSAALEKQMTPEVPALRTQSNQALLNYGNQDVPGLSQSRSALINGMNGSLNTPLLNAAIAKAQSDLALGGNLSVDAQNLATRKALATAGTVGGGGLGLGRDLVARDLGLTSMQVEQQRLQNASQLGGQELGLGTANATNLLNHINLLNQINQGQFGNTLATAQYAEGIQRPIVGLDPGSAANIAVGNANAAGAAQANQANVNGAASRNYANLAGQAFGGLLAYNQNKPTYTGYTPATNNDIYAATNAYQLPNQTAF
jgi:hypothetical protein